MNLRQTYEKNFKVLTNFIRPISKDSPAEAALAVLSLIEAAYGVVAFAIYDDMHETQVTDNVFMGVVCIFVFSLLILNFSLLRRLISSYQSWSEEDVSASIGNYGFALLPFFAFFLYLVFCIKR